MSQVTHLLGRIRAGDERARNALFDAAYEELRHLARARLRDGGRDAELETTSLVNESYLRFIHAKPLRAQNRPAFFAYASRIMHSVILDRVRARGAERRGGGAPHLALTSEIVSDLAADDPVAAKVHEALEVLEQADARLAQVVQMRFFAGQTVKEIADALQLTERTVQRRWEKARLILALALSDSPSAPIAI
jgi:RNA polymerase sigma factor (TIGR02999 family)